MFYAREEVLQKTFEIKNDWLARQDRKRCFNLNLNAENGFFSNFQHRSDKISLSFWLQSSLKKG
jgi:hypothetical protein